MREMKEKEIKVAKFGKAYEGLKTLKIAGILDIVGTSIAALIVLVSVIQMGGFGSKDDISSQQVAEAMGGGSIFIILGFGSMILAIVAYIMQIAGVNEAKTDDEEFDNALIFIVAGIIVSVVSAFFKGWVGSVLSLAVKVLGVIVMICIINGVRSLAQKSGNTKIDNNGKTVCTVVIVLAVVAILSGFANVFFPSIELLLTLITGCLNIAKTVVFVVYLCKGIKMLEENKIEG